ncbi:MAG TPA: AAA family ATPase, partial [Acidobacteriota bacterium]
MKTMHKTGACLLPVCPFVDRKVYEYCRNIIESAALPGRLQTTVDFLIKVLGNKRFTEILQRGIRKKLPVTNAYDQLVCRISEAEIVRLLRQNILPLLGSEISRLDPDTEVDRRLRRVKSVFRLSRPEIDLLAYALTSKSSCALENELEDFVDMRKVTSLMSSSSRLPCTLGYTTLEFQRAMKRNALFRIGLFRKERYSLELQDWLEEYLWGFSTRPLTQHFYTVYRGGTIPLKDHFLQREEKELLLHLLRKNHVRANLLFYGEPGTGKTELARTLAAETGRKLVVLSTRRDSNLTKFKAALTAACNIAPREKSLILVDEADRLLNAEISHLYGADQSNNKAWLNSFLDRSRHKMIWITNDVSDIEPSTMRRFAFSLRFEPLTSARKIRVFQYALRRKKMDVLLTDDQIRRFSEQYSVNAGTIVDVIRNLRFRNRESAAEKIELVLRNHHMAVTGKAPARQRDVTSQYALEVLNPSESLQNVLKVVECFFANANREGMNLLFYGPPGAGKTEFARYLARSLEHEIVVRRASDLMSCWVGQTEKQIARAFDEAARNAAILLLDEADSFLFPRSSARNSWEITQTNEMLTQMEHFPGVLICTTNFLNGLDEAALRRFKFKIEFRPLTGQGCLQLYKFMLSSLCPSPLDEATEQRIAAMKNLTSGDFHLVAQKYSFAPQP